MENCKLTNMCLVYQKDEILVQVSEKKDWPGLTFPGGKIKKGENLDEAIKREVKEETGLTLNKVYLCGIEEFKAEDCDRYFIFFYKCNDFSGELVSSDEGECFWVKRSELHKYELSLDLDLILRVIDDPEVNELVYYWDQGEWCKKLL